MANLIKNIEADDFGIKQLQNCILEIACYFDNFCKKNNIKYYLMGGTALGAIRHQGFIPWDDDFDVFMDFENYTKFMTLAETKIDKEIFYFQREDTAELPYYFCKIRKNGTTCLDSVSKIKNQHKGVFIDVMCLNYVSNKNFVRKLQYYAAALLKVRALTIAGYVTDSKKKKIILFFCKIFVRGPIKYMLKSFVKKNNKKKSKYLAHYFGRAKYKNSVYASDFLGEARYVEFEKVKLPVPEKVEEYLTIRYGKRYMEMPSEETKKIYQNHAVIWDVNKDYKEYEKVE